MANVKSVYISYSARYWALVEKLIAEGLKIHFLQPLNDLTPPQDWAFYNNPSVEFFPTLPEALEGVDFAIGFEWDTVTELRAHCTLRGVPLLEHPREAVLLESNRGLAYDYVWKYCTKLTLVPRITCDSWEEREDTLYNAFDRLGPLVIKQGVHSPEAVINNRTQFILDILSVTKVAESFNQEGNPYFYYGRNAMTKMSGWVGSFIVDKFIEGTELNIGGFFTGNSFVGPVYLSKEYKDPIDGNLSGTMTGEVGSVFEWMSLDEVQRTSGLRELFDDFRSVLCRVNARGPVDVNFIIDADGVAHFVEFTMRWGRPPMESWIAHMTKDGMSVSNALFSLATGSKESISFGFTHKYSVTSVVFHYGIPLIISHIPYAKYSMPVGNDDCITLPLMSKPTCDWLHSKIPQSYYLCDLTGRHFLAVGMSCDSVQDAGYKATDFLDGAKKLGYIPQGCIYRRDVGLAITHGLKELFWTTDPENAK